MNRKTLSLINATAVLLLATLVLAAGPRPAAKKQAPAKQAQVKEPAAAKQESPKEAACPTAPAGPTITAVERAIKLGPIEVYTPVTGVTTAHETYDILAPFDGRVEEVQVELFAFVTPITVLARIISTEMAALLDSTPEGGRKQIERRWQDVYKYYDIKPQFQGVISNIYTRPRTPVYKGDRLFTVAKKVIMIGKNIEPLYSKLAPEMTADIQHYRTAEQFQTRLTDFIRLKDSPLYNRLWLEVQDLKTGIRIGEQFDGQLFIGRNPNARLVPRKSLLERNGKKYLLLEVETGLITEADAEIVRHANNYLEIMNPNPEINPTNKETEDGTIKK